MIPATPPLADPRPADAGGWRRLSPRMLVVHPVREVLRAVPVVAVALIAGGSTGRGQWWALAGTAVAVGIGVMRWFTTGYRISGDQLQVRRGLLQRRVVGVPLDRVRTVDVTRSALHRALGLARLTIGTGRSDRSGDGDLRLDGLSAASAAQLRDDLLLRGREPEAVAAAAAPGAAAAPHAPEGQVLARAEPSWIRYGPFTLSGVIAVLTVAAFAWRITAEFNVDPTRLGITVLGQRAFERVPGWLVVAALPVVLLLVVGAASSVGYALAFWGFRLARLPSGSLQVTRGLVSTRSTTIEERRLRGVEISQPLLLRAAGGARCIAVATGLRVGRGAERGGSLLLPPAPRAVARRVAADVLRAPGAVAAPLTPHGRRALRRRCTRLLLPWAAGVAVLLGLWWGAGLPGWVLAPWLALPVPGAALAADRYRGLGHAVHGSVLVTGWGSLVRRRVLLERDGIIGWNFHRSFFQRRAGLTTLVATTAAGRQRYRVQDIPLPDALQVATDLLPDLVTPFLETGGT